MIDLDILEREVPVTEDSPEKSKKGLYREKMWELNAEDKWNFHFSRLGRYWDSRIEIDIAALDPEGKNLILGECKYWQEPVDIGVLRDLESKADSVSWERNHRKVWFVLFGTAGFTKELELLSKEREDLLLVEL